MKDQKKWSKLSIIAVILFALSILIFPLMGIISAPLFLASLIISIISLVKIKKYNLKGKWLSIMILILTGIISILLILMWIVAILIAIGGGTI